MNTPNTSLAPSQPPTPEQPASTAPGLPMLFLTILVAASFIGSIVLLAVYENPHFLFITFPCIPVFILLCFGFFTLQPNEARVLILFGKYVGTTRKSGFHWTNPFYTKRRLSLRSRNFTSETLKVNDKRGNPVEIGIVVVWRIRETAQAVFDVDDFVSYVHIQAESAVRHLASEYAYDRGEEDELTLRDGGEAVNKTLQVELQERLIKAGVEVEEARITHLAYAPEIAQAMLKRQQAEAIIAARRKIVHGAVSMVDMALHDLKENNVVELDDERKAAMVSNLLVVLCAESEVTPIVNTGTLYQ